MRKALLLICSILITDILPVMADGISVISFKLLDTDLTANTRGTQKLDQNGEKAALIKIVTPERGFLFNGGSLGIVGTEEKAGEIWLYVPPRAQKLTITHEVFGVLRDYFYPVSVQGGRTYEMLLDIGMGCFTTITTSIARSIVSVDGENLGYSPIYYKYLHFGRHIIRASKDRFEGTDTIYITPSDEKKTQVINIEMHNISNLFGDVKVTVDNQADIYFEGSLVGTGSWNTQLREGIYTIETRKTDCDPVESTFQVVRQTMNEIKANPPKPHVGYLTITFPEKVQALLDGTTQLQSGVTVTLPAGEHEVFFKGKGIKKQVRVYEITKDEHRTDTVERK